MYILRALAFLFLTQAVLAQKPTPILPDPKLTPGDTFDVTAQDVCVPGYAKKVRAVPTWLKRQAVKLALEIATQVAASLVAVHKQKLVHRDIKQSNIMVSLEEEGAVTAKIIDLGLAKPVPGAPAESAISIPGTFAGTPEFASPEQFAGFGVDIRSDLYSLGLTLWVMVTGHVMFRGSPAEVINIPAIIKPFWSCSSHATFDRRSNLTR